MELVLKKRFLAFFLPIFLFFFIMIGSLQYYVYVKEKARILDERVDHYSDYLSQRGELIRFLFTSSINDLKYLSINTSVIDFMHIDQPSTKKELLRNLELMAKQNWNYRQVRFIDSTGIEKVRINWENDSLILVRSDALQDKSKRNYFEKTKEIPEGKVYVSPIDLNIEHDVIEQPEQKVIRFGTPVYNQQNRFLGIIIINQYLNDFFDWLLSYDKRWGNEFMLMDADGYWLMAPENYTLYGFMYEKKAGERFAKYFPKAWEYISGKRVGMVKHKDGIFVFRHLSLNYDLKNNKLITADEVYSDAANDWVLLVNVQYEKISDLKKNQNLLIMGLVITFLILIGIFYIIGRSLVKQQQFVNELNKLNRTLEQKVQQRTAEVLKSNEELKVANEELEAFSYSVSHDLRAPLRHITGFVDLLMKKNKDELTGQGAVYLSYIKESATEMNELILELLNFSRVARFDLNKKDFEMILLVEEAKAKIVADYKGQDVLWKIGKLPRVHGDSGLLRQVWVNLLSNALKYSSKKEKSVIEIDFKEEKGTYVFWVKDNGVGFDENYKHKLFMTFQRLHSSDEYEGVGIGLAIVRKIIVRHGGQVWAESRPGEGATFFFSLPFDEK